MSATQIKIMKGHHVMSTIGITDPNQAAILYWSLCKKLRECGSDLTVETNKRNLCDKN